MNTDDTRAINNINNTMSQTMNNVQQHRRQILADGCRKYAHIVNEPKPAGWIDIIIKNYYDDRMQYVYCRIAKTANTNWRRTLMMLGGKLTKYRRPEQIPLDVVYKDKDIKRLNGLPQGEREWRLRKYFKFVFVREPLERLLSAYRDKVATNEHLYRKVAGDIVRKYRPHDYKPSAKRYDTTFAEFVRYVLDQHAAGRVLDRHWLPQYLGCPVCKPVFDFVGHYETLHRDAEFVVSKLKSRIRNKLHRRRVQNIRFPASSSHSKTKDLMQQMYATVPAAHIQALYKLYAIDYALFGYKHPNVTRFK